jgi:hypothetical protein
MKRNCCRIAGAGLVVLLFCLAGAAGQKNTPVKKAEVPRVPFAKGTIQRLELPAKQLTVKTATGAERFLLTDTTYIFRGKTKITADQLKIGELIRLSFYTNNVGDTLVRRIKVDPVDAVPTPITP